jgi:hypothetical protein
LQDILLRRNKEFDKPDLITNLFYGIAPDFHAVQITNDRWRYQRKLLQDLMTPAFLNGVAAPQLHQSFMDLIELWSVKMRLSEGHPFSVKHDIFDTALEAIWSAVFGNEGTATVTKNQIKLLSGQNRISLPSSIDDAVEFPRAPAPPNFLAVLELTDSIESVTKSPLPKTTGFIQRYLPHGRKHLATKKRFTNEEITKAEKRMKESEGKEAKITNAVDHLLRREKMAAEKAQRPPQYHSNVMVDEVSWQYSSTSDTIMTNNNTDLRPSHRRPRHNLHHPILGSQIPHSIPIHPTKTPLRTPVHLWRRPRRTPRPNRPRNRHNAMPLP